MDYAHPESARPASHMEQVVSIKEINAWLKPQAFAFMSQVDGWCSEQKASILIDIVLQAKPEKIVEIGVYGGKSLIPMACALRANGHGKIYGIDPWDTQASLQGVMHPSNIAHWSWVDHPALMNTLIVKRKQFNLEDYMVLIRNTSEKADLIYDIDILHVDGNHSEVTSYLDVTKWVPLMKPGGWIIFDDMTWSENNTNTTGRAVRWLDEHCEKFAQFKDNCDWGIWRTKKQ